MKRYWESGGIAPFLTSALYGCTLSASRSGRFIPGIRPQKRLGGPQNRYGRGDEEKNLISLLSPENKTS
jgi:hypothetical protein